MNSSFFWKNLFLVLLIAANFAFSVWLFLRKPAERRPADAEATQAAESAPNEETSDGRSMPVALRVVLRTLCVLYATVSGLLLLVGVIYFCEMELSGTARECLKRSQEWPRIKAGMTRQQVLEILGQPDTYDTWNEAERLKYRLHPLDLPESADVSLTLPDSTHAGAEQKVVEKSPSDQDWAENPPEWWPYSGSYRHSALIRHCFETAMILSFIGIILLAIITVIPVWSCTDWRSAALYFPAAALVFCVGYEAGQKGGWRFDLFLLYPMYGIILVVWLFRVIHVASK